jgi:hypothetical protein
MRRSLAEQVLSFELAEIRIQIGDKRRGKALEGERVLAATVRDREFPERGASSNPRDIPGQDRLSSGLLWPRDEALEMRSPR